MKAPIVDITKRKKGPNKFVGQVKQQESLESANAEKYRCCDKKEIEDISRNIKKEMRKFGSKEWRERKAQN